ncbi:EAL domain-containing protein [Bacillus sp. RO2]|uniref:EAL domain-containing protein n=1 Tax=Bacillus sp. RO2 TaxID=2723913 RepID=UPI00145E2B41|nr:EAL domain-containing protein [Bacillus sp. RO2]NMH75402.1 EAL domain-containing protein [Bacillus sp. RO2]
MGRSWNRIKRYYNKNGSHLVKIMLPSKYLRYYPPIFILRNPIEQRVKHTLKKGFQVAVISFYFPDLENIISKIGRRKYLSCREAIKAQLRKVIGQTFVDEEIVCLHEQYSDGISLLLKVDARFHSTTELEDRLAKVKTVIERRKYKQLDNQHLCVQSGYVFLESGEYSLSECMLKAHVQAMAMAEKQDKLQYQQLKFQINQIIAFKDITLLAQPIIDVSKGGIKAWELLTRGPKGSLMENPLQLFSIAKQTNRLFLLELLILEKAFQLIYQCKMKEAIFINFTPTTLNEVELIEKMLVLLKKYPEIIPQNIAIEVTEQDSIDGLKNFERNIVALRELGFQIAVDDTGAGYASFHTINRIMPDIIKIDRSVIQDIDKNMVKEKMLQGLLLIANETGSLVVAEGIERPEEVQILSKHKVDMAQGYFYARPKLLQPIT